MTNVPAFSSLDSSALLKLMRQMNHDMRGPLNIILATADLLIDGAYETLDNDQGLAVARIRHSGERLYAIIDQMMTYIKALSGDYALEVGSFPLKGLVEKCITTIRAHADQKQLQVVVTFEPTAPDVIEVDSDVFHKLILALLWNAVSFTPSGQIQIRVYVDPELPRYWCVDLSDTGPGISDKIRATLYQPFQRGTIRGSPVPTAGSGLGLALANALSNVLNGQLDLKPASERGTVFTVRMPILWRSENAGMQVYKLGDS